LRVLRIPLFGYKIPQFISDDRTSTLIVS